MPGTLGSQTDTIFFKGFNDTNLYNEFTVATGNSISKGQPVKLDNAGDIIPYAKGDGIEQIVGYSLHDADAEEQATIAMRGYGIIFAEAPSSQNAGMAQWDSFNSSSGYNVYAYVAPASQSSFEAWAIDDASSTGDQIRVVLI